MHTIFESKKLKQKVTIEELVKQTGRILPNREELTTMDYGGSGYTEDIYIYTGYPGHGNGGYPYVDHIDFRDDCFRNGNNIYWGDDFDWKHDGKHGWDHNPHDSGDFRNVTFSPDPYFYGYDPYGYGYADPYYGGSGYDPMRGYGYVPGRGWI